MLDVFSVINEQIGWWKLSLEHSRKRSHPYFEWKLVEPLEYNRVRLEEAVIYVYVSISASTRSR